MNGADVYPGAYEPVGRFERHTIVSEALRGNPLGDPHERPLWVYTPPGYEEEADRRYASVYVIQGYTGQVDMWWNRTPFTPSFPELADQLFVSGDAPPAIVVWVDGWTAIGGSQFVDSPAIGSYHTHLCDEIVPWVDEHYRTLPEAERRGIQGKSSGGYGAMITPMLRPDLFGGLATHAGDALFEHCYARDFAPTLRELRKSYGGSFERFWEDFFGRPGIQKTADAQIVNTWGMAAAYSANADGSIDLPFDLDTGAFRQDVWERWLAWDPVRMVEKHADAARSWKAVYIDSGKSDEYYLDLGAEAFRLALERVGVTDIFFELFEGTHGRLTWRYPISLKYLAERLSP